MKNTKQNATRTARKMTVQALLDKLNGFPPHFPVFVSADGDAHRALRPREVVMNLVHPQQQRIIEDDESRVSVPSGYIDSVVIYARP